MAPYAGIPNQLRVEERIRCARHLFDELHEVRFSSHPLELLLAAERVSDQHAVILNRNRDASMILPGESLLLVEMTPALFAAAAANEAEKVAPENTLVDVQMIGASGRVFISGAPDGIQRARDRIMMVLETVTGKAR